MSPKKSDVSRAQPRSTVYGKGGRGTGSGGKGPTTTLAQPTKSEPETNGTPVEQQSAKVAEVASLQQDQPKVTAPPAANSSFKDMLLKPRPATTAPTKPVAQNQAAKQAASVAVEPKATAATAAVEASTVEKQQAPPIAISPVENQQSAGISFGSFSETVETELPRVGQVSVPEAAQQPTHDRTKALKEEGPGTRTYMRTNSTPHSSSKEPIFVPDKLKVSNKYEQGSSPKLPPPPTAAAIELSSAPIHPLPQAEAIVLPAEHLLEPLQATPPHSEIPEALAPSLDAPTQLPQAFPDKGYSKGEHSQPHERQKNKGRGASQDRSEKQVGHMLEKPQHTMAMEKIQYGDVQENQEGVTEKKLLQGGQVKGRMQQHDHSRQPSYKQTSQPSSMGAKFDGHYTETNSAWNAGRPVHQQQQQHHQQQQHQQQQQHVVSYGYSEQQPRGPHQGYSNARTNVNFRTQGAPAQNYPVPFLPATAVAQQNNGLGYSGYPAQMPLLYAQSIGGQMPTSYGPGPYVQQLSAGYPAQQASFTPQRGNFLPQSSPPPPPPKENFPVAKDSSVSKSKGLGIYNPETKEKLEMQPRPVPEGGRVSMTPPAPSQQSRALPINPPPPFSKASSKGGPREPPKGPAPGAAAPGAAATAAEPSRQLVSMMQPPGVKVPTGEPPAPLAPEPTKPAAVEVLAQSAASPPALPAAGSKQAPSALPVEEPAVVVEEAAAEPAVAAAVVADEAPVAVVSEPEPKAVEAAVAVAAVEEVEVPAKLPEAPEVAPTPVTVEAPTPAEPEEPAAAQEAVPTKEEAIVEIAATVTTAEEVPAEPVAEVIAVVEAAAEPAAVPEPAAEPAAVPEPAAEPAAVPEPATEPVPVAAAPAVEEAPAVSAAVEAAVVSAAAEQVPVAVEEPVAETAAVEETAVAPAEPSAEVAAVEVAAAPAVPEDNASVPPAAAEPRAVEEEEAAAPAAADEKPVATEAVEAAATETSTVQATPAVAATAEVKEPTSSDLSSVAPNKKNKKKEALKKADAAQPNSDLLSIYRKSSDAAPSQEEAPAPKESAKSAPPMKVPAIETKVETEEVNDDWEAAAEAKTPRLPTNISTADTRERRIYSRDFMKSLAQSAPSLPSDLDLEALPPELLNGPIETHAGGYNRSGSGQQRPGSDDWSARRGGDFDARNMQGGMRNPASNMDRRNDDPRSFRPGGPAPPMDDKWTRNTPMPPSMARGAPPPPARAGMPLHHAESRFTLGQSLTSDPDEEKRQKTFKGILNKLTVDNFEKLSERICDVGIEQIKTLEGLINQIFDKALIETTFCEMYANLCKAIHPKLPTFPVPGEPEGKHIDFRRLLLNKCQEEFEKGNVAMQAVKEREQKEGTETTTENKEEKEEGEVTAEEAKAKEETRAAKEAELKARWRMLGNIHFIGHLYRASLLTEKIMHSCIISLLQEDSNPRSEDVECLCKLMLTVGHLLEVSGRPEHRNAMDVYFSRMKRLRQNVNLDSRLRFMIQDVLDQRDRKWVARQKSEGPKKIEDVHREAAQQAQATADRDRAERMKETRGRPRDQYGGQSGGPQRSQFPDRSAAVMDRDVPSQGFAIGKTSSSSEVSLRPAGPGPFSSRNAMARPDTSSGPPARPGGRGISAGGANPPAPPAAGPSPVIDTPEDAFSDIDEDAD